ncbi:uncharacterized protein PGTG_20980 [Puccinia graminis f. sp. tritici CRL 75-36-700-3]|uniref:Uncharacterized protein n=1 Tax=Puccinia graminis f. sp. tritici (strain CRL 75-36-700-3 / race SCCL) TaxID=418459 RepID=H6QPZ5_PUCGT|nr:uncharacterized protein PGTG_20980 [Puccinia graminis f. sp. tritici CRL 75-36-700-3]EHS64518.1 hypothetical protein PGTG_20980 [Puccinia graminis f. sp. tritici CRL 75-36-700-3]
MQVQKGRLQKATLITQLYIPGLSELTSISPRTSFTNPLQPSACYLTQLAICPSAEECNCMAYALYGQRLVE